MLDDWQQQGHALLQPTAVSDKVWSIAAMAHALRNGSSWRSNSVSAYDLTLQCGSSLRTLRVDADRHGHVKVSHLGQQDSGEWVEWTDGKLRLRFNGVQITCIAVWDAATLHLAFEGETYAFQEPSALQAQVNGTDASCLRAPVAGTVKVVRVAVGDKVTAGQQLVCVEAMKMEMWQCAATDARVRAVHVQVGDQVPAGTPLVDMEIEG